MAFSLGGSGGGSRRRRFGASNGTLSEINIVPLVDVVLVLLIIFMLTAHVMDYGMEIEVPKTKITKENNEVLPIVYIQSDQTLRLNEKTVNINDLAAQTREAVQGPEERVRRGRPVGQVGHPGAGFSGTGRREGHSAHGHEANGVEGEMTADVLMRPDPKGRSFALALMLHGSLLGAALLINWLHANPDKMGDPNAGGASVGVEVVNKIPISAFGSAESFGQ